MQHTFNAFRVEVTDLRDGSVYPTIEQAAKELYMSTGALRKAYREGRTKVLGVPVAFKRVRRVGNGGPVGCRCKETGQVFGSMLDAGKSIGVGSARIRYSIKTSAEVDGFHFEAI